MLSGLVSDAVALAYVLLAVPYVVLCVFLNRKSKD